MKKSIIIFLILFIIFSIITIISPIDLDGIWCYGFSYNISKGLIPYKDFNMVIGPLYSLIFSIPMIFGNYMILFKLEHVLLYSLVFTLIYKKIGLKSIYMILLMGTALTICGYNMFIVILLLLILLLLDSKNKYKEYIIGIIIGLIIMTKQNVGGCLAILYFFTSKNKVKNTISVLVGMLPIFIYLVLNNSFNQYIDFCYLGLGNFLDNFVLEPLSLILWLLCFYLLLKQFKNNKDIKLYYILIFQIIAFPIVDQGHIVPAIIPIIYYLLLNNKEEKVELYIKMFTIIGFIMINIVLPIMKCEFNTKNNFLKYQVQTRGLNKYLKNYSNYIDNTRNKKLYLLVENAYIIKLYRKEELDFYDLINDGNLGSNQEKYIGLLDKECKDKECLFILDHRYFEKTNYFQYSKSFKKHIIDNYKYLETLPSGDVVYYN